MQIEEGPTSNSSGSLINPIYLATPKIQKFYEKNLNSIQDQSTSANVNRKKLIHLISTPQDTNTSSAKRKNKFNLSKSPIS